MLHIVVQPVHAGQCRVIASRVGLQHGCNIVATSVEMRLQKLHGCNMPEQIQWSQSVRKVSLYQRVCTI